ncbi:MAG: hypothetical protein J07HQW2_01754 [Haloquadratum walsbyi J07HQW2]|uniref:Uncharacterized protein n=1 Tax=Haloquadratum walsbyi J07HQW2 TaxID=1238425 RepID=U1PSE9_9EURY|nr:MAG: hypothetical protein J07HQW2_01754 [Haloquadratum walsbyi J07HQW2]
MKTKQSARKTAVIKKINSKHSLPRPRVTPGAAQNKHNQNEPGKQLTPTTTRVHTRHG